MKCVTPMFRRYEVGNYSKGKVVAREEVIDILHIHDPNYITLCLNEMNNFQRMKGTGYLYEQIPCGHCYACLLNKSAEWATRNVCECEDHEHRYWLTLTYDEEHLPIYKYFTDGTNYFENDGTWNGTLEEEDVIRFLNSLRKYYERKGIYHIRYYYAAEYGEQNKRPHYHMLLYGAPFDLKQFYDFDIDERKNLHWKSHEIDHFWNKGFVDITEIEWSNAAYTSRYTMKKLCDLKAPDIVYAEQGKIKEFVRMSRRPGIGMKYFDRHYKEIYKDDELIMKTVKGNTGAIKPPKAFDKKFKELYPTEFRIIKNSRLKAAERSRELELSQSDYNDLERLQIEADKIGLKVKWLPREL